MAFWDSKLAKIISEAIGQAVSMCDNDVRVKGTSGDGKKHSDYRNRPGPCHDSMRYRVEITGLEQRTFEVKIPLSTVVKPGREEEIKKLFAHGPLPENGDIKVLADLGW